MNYYIFTYRTNYGKKTSIIQATCLEAAKGVAESSRSQVWPNYTVQKLSEIDKPEGIPEEIYATP
jgi:phage tail protein X